MVFRTLKGVGTTFIYKDGFGAGNSATENVVANNVVNDDETYIGGRNNKKLVMNKINHTKVGDDIHYYMNGVEGRGIVVKMSNEYVLVAKEDGDFQDIHISDTFFVKDIVINKTWDNMDSNERTDVLLKAHAPSPRFVTKDWHNLPVELREVLTKFTGSTSEAGISRDDETKTHRDQDQSLAANNPTTDDEQAKGLKNDTKKANVGDKTGIKCERCGAETEHTILSLDHGGKDKHLYGHQCPKCDADWEYSKKGYGDEFKEGGFSQQSSKKKKKRGKKCVSCGKVHKSDVEEGAYGAAGGSPDAGVNTSTPLDVSADTGYEERPHICAECVGNLPREDAKGHHDKETEEKKSPAKVKEPHESSTKEKEKSEQFRKIYGGGKKKKKGVPEWNVNSWGIDYTVKEDE